MREEQGRRRAAVQRACLKRRKNDTNEEKGKTAKWAPPPLLLDLERRVAYCRHAKVIHSFKLF